MKGGYTHMTKIEKWLINSGYDIKALNNDTREYKVTNLDQAAKIIQEAIAQGRTIYVLADYDCDGIMSGCILYTMLTELGADFYLRFPKKISEGYGLSEKIVPEIPDGALLITIDNGIAACEIIEDIKTRNIDTVILDHHIIRGDGLVPNAQCVVDPHIYREEGEFEDYCGAGIGYKLAKLMNLKKETLQVCNIFAAIATVQDIVPMKDDNRNIVKEGLRLLNARTVAHRPELTGIYSLMDKMYLRTSEKLESAFQEGDISYYLGPCINAMGRIHDAGAQMVFERLMHYDKNGMDGVLEVIECNKERKELTKKQQDILNAEAEKLINSRTTCLVVYAPNLHEGVIGINAAKITELFHMPAIVLTDSEDGKLKGSARSLPDVNMKELLDSAAEYIFAYGGHAGAAGLTVEKDKLKDLRKALNKNCPKSKTSQSTWVYDMEISEDEIPEVFSQVRKYAPYGEDFHAPVFKVTGYKLVSKRDRNGNYATHRMLPSDGIAFNGGAVNGVSFTVKDKFKKVGSPANMNVIATLGWSSYDKAVQMSISDLQPLATATAEPDDGYLI